MADDLRLSIKITADGKIASAEINKLGKDAERAMGGIEKSGTKGAEAINKVGKEASKAASETQKLGSAASSIGPKLAAAFSTVAVIGFAKALTDTARKFDSVNKSLSAISGSAQAAASDFAFVQRTANKLGLEITSTANAFANLNASAQGTALQGEGTRKVFEAVSKAMAGLGKSSYDTEGALLAIGQMMSKGTVQAEELRGQLGERLPGAFNVAARAMGVTTAELSKMLENGQVVAEDFLPKFAAELDRTYSKARFDGISNNINRITNAWEGFKASLAQELNVDGIMSGLAERAELLARAFEKLRGAKNAILDPMVAAKNKLFGFSEDKEAEIYQRDVQRSIADAFPNTTFAPKAATQELQKLAPVAEKAATATTKVAKAHASAAGAARSHASATATLQKEEERRYQNLQTNADRAVESTFDERQRIEQKYKESTAAIIGLEEAAAKRGIKLGEQYAQARIDLEKQKYDELTEITKREEDQMRSDLQDISSDVFKEFNNAAKDSADEFSYQFEQASKNVHNVLSDLFSSIINGDMGNIGKSLSRSLGNLAGNGFSLALEKLMSGNGTAGNGGLLGWVSGLFGGGSGGTSFGSIFSGLFGNGGASGSDGGGALSGLFGGGSGGSALSMVSGVASIVAGIMSQFKGIFGSNPKSRSIGNSLEGGGQKEILDIVDMLGNIPFFWALKFAKPIVKGENQLGQSLFGNDRRPNMTANWASNLLAPGIGQLMGWLFSSVPKGGATVNVGKNNAFSLASSFSKGGAEDFKEISEQQALAIAEAVGKVEKALHMEFGKLRITTYNRGEETSFAISDKTGNRYYSGMQEAKHFNLQKAANEAFAELIRANIDQVDPQYRGAARRAKTASEFIKLKGRADEILNFTGQGSELTGQLEILESTFERLRKRAKNLGLSLEEVDKAMDRNRAAIKRGVEDQFRALAGLAPTLQSALGSLNDQIIKLTADARAVGMSEGSISKLSSLAVSNARTGYLSPVQTALDGAKAFLGQGGPVNFDKLMTDILFAESPEETANAMAKFSAAVDNAAASVESINGGFKSLDEFLNVLKLSDLAPSTPEQRYRESQGQFNSALMKAQAGDASALASLPQLAQQFLGESQYYFGGNTSYAKDFQGVQDALGLLSASGAGVAAKAAGGAPAQEQAAQFLVDAGSAKVRQFEQAFDTSAANTIVAAAPITKNAVDTIEDEIAALVKLKAETSGPKRKKAIQDQIDALKRRKKIEVKKLNAKASGGWTSGLTLVGEAGPEIIDVPGAALVQNHRQTQSIMSRGNDTQVQELKAQTKELQALVRLQQAANKALLAELQASREHLYDIDRRQRLAG